MQLGLRHLSALCLNEASTLVTFSPRDRTPEAINRWWREALHVFAGA